MDTVVIPSETVPESLKACEQILKRAKELKKAEPVVAYWCCFSAAQTALKVPNRTKESTMFLMSLLDALEQMKAILGANEAVTSEAAGSAFVENFALKVFLSADNEDRAGNAGKATIRKFVVAGQFIEVLRCFETGMTEEMEQKAAYARWKAADLAKALREGRTPVPGPPLPEEEISPFPTLPTGSPSSSSSPMFPVPPTNQTTSSPPSRPNMQNDIFTMPSPPKSHGISPRPSPIHTPPPDLSDSRRSSSELRTPIARNDSSSSGVWSTVATPGIPDEPGETRYHSSSSPTNDDSNDSASPTFKSMEDKKNVRFMGPDGAPLSPATTHLTVDSYDVPSAPPPSIILPPSRPRGDSASSYRSMGTPTNGHTPLHKPNNPPPSAPPAPSGTYFPSTNPPNTGSQGLGLIHPSASVPSVPVPPAATTQPLPSAPPTRKQIEQTQKHARWAISALEFDDVETARSELRKAMAMLG